MREMTSWKIIAKSLGYFATGLIAIGVFLMFVVPVVRLLMTGMREGAKAVLADYIVYLLPIPFYLFWLWISYILFRLAFRIIFYKEERKDIY